MKCQGKAFWKMVRAMLRIAYTYAHESGAEPTPDDPLKMTLEFTNGAAIHISSPHLGVMPCRRYMAGVRIVHVEPFNRFGRRLPFPRSNRFE